MKIQMATLALDLWLDAGEMQKNRSYRAWQKRRNMKRGNQERGPTSGPGR